MSGRAEKYAVLLGDGMADRPVPELGGRTPLEAAQTPNMDRLAAGGVLGLARTLPDGMALGSDVANLSVLGYDPASVYTGRSPLEAAGMGVELGPRDVAFRCNLVTVGERDGQGLSTSLSRRMPSKDLVMVDFAGGHPSAGEADGYLAALREALAGEGIELFSGVSYRHLLVWRGGEDELTVSPPHDLTDKKLDQGWPVGKAAQKVLSLMERAMAILPDTAPNRARAAAGKAPVNAVWLWGQGRRPSLEPFSARYGISGAMITAVDLLRGLGVSLGFEVIRVPGATGYLDTNYEGKARAAVEALRRVDLVYLHVEAPDEAAHGGSLANKMRALEDFDSRVVGPVLEGLKGFGSYRVLLMPDHATPLEIKTHSNDPVPFAVFDSMGVLPASGLPYTELAAASTGCYVSKGHELMGKFLGGMLC